MHAEIPIYYDDIVIKIKDLLPALKEDNAKLATIKVETLVTTAHLDSGVVDQKYIGSCVAFSIVAAMEHDLIRQNLENSKYKFSERQLYIVSRVYYEHVRPQDDSGITHLSGLEALKNFGLVSATDAPYIERGETVRFWVEVEAEEIRCITDEIIQHIEITRVRNRIEDIKDYIDKGHPVIIMFRVPYNIFKKDVNDTGIIPPNSRHDTTQYHSVLCVGYENKRKLLQFKNSWGKDWGVGGYGYIRYDNEIMDTCWILKTILRDAQPISEISSASLSA